MNPRQSKRISRERQIPLGDSRVVSYLSRLARRGDKPGSLPGWRQFTSGAIAKAAMVRTPSKHLKLSKPLRKSLPPTRDQIAQEFKTMQSQSEWNLTDFEDVFVIIRADWNAWSAFEEIVRCGYKQDHLLMSLAITFSHDPRSTLFLSGTHWDGWTPWNEKWKGLKGVANTLTLIATKMEKHIAKSDRGPIPLPTLSGSEKGSADYHKSNLSGKRLAEIHSSIVAMTEEIKQYCEMARDWRKVVPRSDIIEDESLRLFVESIKACTGEWHIPEVAKLLSAGGVSVSEETLWKMLKLRTPLLDRSDPKTGHQWEPDIGKF